MEEATSTKKYLKECHEKVVEPALKGGLDTDCYYLYLSEVYRALAGDAGVRRKYQAMLRECAKEIARSHKNQDGKVWQERYVTIFRKQCDFMADLLKFIVDGKVIDDETKALAMAQANFIRMQLYAQKRHLDTVRFYASLRDDNIRAGYEDGMIGYETAVSYLKGVMTYLEDID